MRPDLIKAHQFVLGSARLLDRKRFEFRFEGSAGQSVVCALLAYQNADGGFGNALEPDLRCAASQPVPTELAFEILDEVGEFRPEIVQPCCNWLSGVTTEEGGVPFVLENVKEGPHAPWWKATGEASLNPTAGLVGLLQKHAVKHPWVAAATEYCWRCLEKSDLDRVGPDDAISIIKFLEWAPERRRASVVWNVLGEVIKSRLVSYDPDAAGYVKTPLDFATSPDGMAFRLFESDAISTHLEILAKRQQVDGGWPISWVPPSGTAIDEWRGFVTVKSLVILDKYKRLHTTAA
jgi:hypothetical protein